jgi:hypothetical protein
VALLHTQVHVLLASIIKLRVLNINMIIIFTIRTTVFSQISSECQRVADDIQFLLTF